MLRTPFYQFNLDHKAKFVDFAGWEMPISFGSIIEEHNRVRTAGGLFDVFGSDHAPHTRAEKAAPYPQSPSGMPGVQTMLPVLLNFAGQGLINLKDIVRMGCENPALLYGIRDRGFLKPGFLANLVLVDPDHKWTVEAGWLQSKCGWSPYEGETLMGKPIHVILGGAMVVQEGGLRGRPSGQMVDFDWK